MGAGGFHGRVRDGIGCWGPRYGHQVCEAPGLSREEGSFVVSVWDCRSASWALPFGRFAAARGVIALEDPWVLLRGILDQACRAISTGQLRASPPFHTRPIDVLVLHGSRGVSVSRRVSRLDAFSGYPVRT